MKVLQESARGQPQAPSGLRVSRSRSGPLAPLGRAGEGFPLGDGYESSTNLSFPASGRRVGDEGG